MGLAGRPEAVPAASGIWAVWGEGTEGEQGKSWALRPWSWPPPGTPAQEFWVEEPWHQGTGALSHFRAGGSGVPTPLSSSVSLGGLGDQPRTKMWKQHFGKASFWRGAASCPFDWPLTLQQEPTRLLHSLPTFSGMFPGVFRWIPLWVAGCMVMGNTELRRPTLPAEARLRP